MSEATRSLKAYRELEMDRKVKFMSRQKLDVLKAFILALIVLVLLVCIRSTVCSCYIVASGCAITGIVEIYMSFHQPVAADSSPDIAKKWFKWLIPLILFLGGFEMLQTGLAYQIPSPGFVDPDPVRTAIIYSIVASISVFGFTVIYLLHFHSWQEMRRPKN